MTPTEFVGRSRRAQGLPPKVIDPGALTRVARLVVRDADSARVSNPKKEAEK